MGAVEVLLPGGIAVDGQWRRSAWVNPVTGHEEEFLLTAGKFLPAAARATELIRRCLQSIGSVERVDAAMVRRLSVGDRESLLLHLRRLTLGDRISCVIPCPACSRKMDLDLSIGELLQPPYPHETALHETDITDVEQAYHVVFRLPNGEDQEAVSAIAAQSVDSAAELVLRRCVCKVSSCREELVAIPEAVRRELPGRMAELDPQAEVLLDLTCPECGAGFEVPFDITDYFCRELAGQEREFYRGVHVLSFHYHWNEDAILSLDRRKRHIYLDLLADDLAVSRNG